MSQARVRVLEKLYEQGQASDVVDLALEKLLAHVLATSRLQLAQLEGDLAEFEHRFGMSSDFFYSRFQAGEIGDAMDYVEWASLFQMALRLRDRFDLLEAASVTSIIDARQVSSPVYP